jgi:hypothetical protein
MTINQMVISPFDKLRVTIQDFCKSLKLTPKRLSFVISKYGKDKAETLKCTYRKVYEMFNNGFRVVKRLVEEFPSEWSYEGVFNEPF